MSAALLSTDLTWMRDLLNTSLPRTCTVSTPGTNSADDYGNSTNTPTTVSGVKCSYMAATGQERLLGGALAQIGNYVLTFEVGAVLTPKASVTVDASGSEAARTFQLVAPLDEPNMIGRRWLATEG